jgi:L-cysteine:1D-myo-inositol 2-amino-2-deoxy-alpha-D-glucopyranoside ligase
MVRLDGEKMSKSRGNLVFLSRLLQAGSDPMAVRLAIISHHYRTDWDWTPATLTGGAARIATWRAAVEAAGRPDPAAPASAAATASAVASVAGAETLAAMRERLADDLDAPGAIAVVDEWAAGARDGRAAGSGTLVRAAVDALLGVVV